MKVFGFKEKNCNKKIFCLLVCCCSVALAFDTKKDDRMLLIPAGVLRGIDPDFGEVCLTNSRAFLMDKTVVTEAFFAEVYDRLDARTGDYIHFRQGEGLTPLHVFETRDHPVSGVSFRNAVLWCNARSKLEGLTLCYLNAKKEEYRGGHGETIWCDFSATGYRLPTSSEWEYAARAGECTRFPWGDTICFTNANYTGGKANYDLSGGGLHPVYSKGVNVEFFEQAISPVMSFPPNRFGLYDMIGNVAEWCWPDNKTEVEFKRYSRFILRGGSWRSWTQSLRAGTEDEVYEEDCMIGRRFYWELLASGFRCVRKAPVE